MASWLSGSLSEVVLILINFQRIALFLFLLLANKIGCCCCCCCCHVMSKMRELCTIAHQVTDTAHSSYLWSNLLEIQQS